MAFTLNTVHKFNIYYSNGFDSTYAHSYQEARRWAKARTDERYYPIKGIEKVTPSYAV